jgi:hypothetical protein
MVLAVKGQQRALANTCEMPRSKYEAAFRPSQKITAKIAAHSGIWKSDSGMFGPDGPSCPLKSPHAQTLSAPIASAFATLCPWRCQCRRR